MRWCAPAVFLLCGCNHYEMFAMSGFSGQYLPPKADVLFVVDSSESMYEESEALALAAGALAGELDALAMSWERDNDNAATFPDYQFSITTLDAQVVRGAVRGNQPFFRRDESGLDAAFEQALLCDAVCFPAELEGVVTPEYLDDLCGNDRWRSNCGGESEEGLETVLLALCRAVPEPPEECFEIPSLFDGGDVLANEGLLRDDSVFIPIIVSDEGDASRRMTQLDVPPSAYNRIFNKFETRMSWGVIAPSLGEDGEPRCPSVATSWGVLRYQYIAETTGGVMIDIHSPSCSPGDFEEGFARLADLIGGRSHAFYLRSPAIEETILVRVDDLAVPHASGGDPDRFGFPRFGDGWSYQADPPTVMLHGSAAPGPVDKVRIWYQPLIEGQ